jgi:hypothetical protein
MYNRPYSFSFLFHEHYSLEYRKEVYQKYAQDYIVKLYRLPGGFAFPDLLMKEAYEAEDFLHADGIVVGDKLGEQVTRTYPGKSHFGFFQLPILAVGEEHH